MSTVRLINILKDSYGTDITDMVFSGAQVSIKSIEERVFNEKGATHGTTGSGTEC